MNDAENRRFFRTRRRKVVQERVDRRVVFQLEISRKFSEIAEINYDKLTLKPTTLPTTEYQNFKRVKKILMGQNTRFSELDGFSRQPIGTRHFASTTHAARTPRRVPRRAAASEVPRMDPFETPPATQSSVDPFRTPPATPRPARDPV